MRVVIVAVLLAFTALSARAADLPTDVFSTSVDGRTAYCGLYKGKWQPVIKSGKSYKAISAEIKSLRSKLSGASSSTRKRIEQRIKTLKALVSLTKARCALGPSVGPTPTPSPTPTAVGCFVAGGDTRPGCFGIPEPLVGNEMRGETYFRTNCTGCHLTRPAYPYPYVLSVFDRVPQMAPFRPAPPDLADIVAYLNRFNF